MRRRAHDHSNNNLTHKKDSIKKYRLAYCTTYAWAWGFFICCYCCCLVAIACYIQQQSSESRQTKLSLSLFSVFRTFICFTSLTPPSLFLFPNALKRKWNTMNGVFSRSAVDGFSFVENWTLKFAVNLFQLFHSICLLLLFFSSAQFHANGNKIKHFEFIGTINLPIEIKTNNRRFF